MVAPSVQGQGKGRTPNELGWEGVADQPHLGCALELHLLQSDRMLLIDAAHKQADFVWLPQLQARHHRAAPPPRRRRRRAASSELPNH